MKKLIFAALIILLAVPAQATISFTNGYWSTTFSGCDANPINTNTNVCDGLDVAGYDYATATGARSAILSAANHSGGAGGSGFRQYFYPSRNDNSTPLRAIFATPQQEFWVRFYYKIPTGQSMGGIWEHKLLYATMAGGATMVVQWPYYGSGQWGIEPLYGSATGTEYYTYSDGRWSTLFGSAVSNGTWHCFEIYMHRGTTTGNGVFRMWIDGVMVTNDTTVDFISAGGTGFSQIEPTLNHNVFTLSGSQPHDIDDIAFATSSYSGFVQNTAGIATGYNMIGPIGFAPGADTAAPTLVSATIPQAGNTISLLFSETISAGAGGYTGFALTPSGAAATMTYSSGSGTNTLVYTLSRFIYNNETATIAYTQPGTGIRDTASTPNYLASFSGSTVTINSTINPSGLLLSESFNDTSFAARGWYDAEGSGGGVTTSSPYAGAAAYRCTLAEGAQVCSEGDLKRHTFTASDNIKLSAWIRLSANWEGSGLDYHPHIFYILSDLDGAYDGFSCTRNTIYMEIGTGGFLRLTIQDGESVNPSYITTGSAMLNAPNPAAGENRSIGGCNGTQGNSAVGIPDCYVGSCPGGAYVNFREFRSGSGYFADANWHKLEAQYKMNSINGGVAVPDGILRLWYDGQIIFDLNNVLFRTGDRATMKWDKIGISPYIGDGSPVTQTLDIDELTLYAISDTDPVVLRRATGGGTIAGSIH